MSDITRLKKIRLQKGFTQSQISLMSGVLIGTLQKYESGEIDIKRARVDIVYKLSQALGTTIEELIK